jgi:hypothetical protein
MGGGPEVATGGVCAAGDRDGDFFRHIVLWDEVCAGGARGWAGIVIVGGKELLTAEIAKEGRRGR